MVGDWACAFSGVYLALTVAGDQRDVVFLLLLLLVARECASDLRGAMLASVVGDIFLLFAYILVSPFFSNNLFCFLWLLFILSQVSAH